MKKAYWIIDLHRHRKYGPYSNKKAAAKDMTKVKVLSDAFLEVGTNVGILDAADAGDDLYDRMLEFPEGSMLDVIESNNRLRGMQNDADVKALERQMSD